MASLYVIRACWKIPFLLHRRLALGGLYRRGELLASGD
jgi:hypothetical protein